MSEASEPTGSTPGSTNPGQGERSGRNGKLNWTQILSDAGVPESPGFLECSEKIASRPKRTAVRTGKKGRKGK